MAIDIVRCQLCSEATSANIKLFHLLKFVSDGKKSRWLVTYVRMHYLQYIMYEEKKQPRELKLS